MYNNTPVSCMTFSLCKWRATISNSTNKKQNQTLERYNIRLRLRRGQLTVVASSPRWVAKPNNEGEELDKHPQFASFCIRTVLTPSPYIVLKDVLNQEDPHPMDCFYSSHNCLVHNKTHWCQTTFATEKIDPMMILPN